MYDKINSPMAIRTTTFKNRLVFAPTSMGLPEEEYIKKLKEIAEGGTGLITIGDVPVLKHGGFGKSLYSKKGFAFYERVVNTIHDSGSAVCAQLHVSDSDLLGMIQYIPGVLTGKIPKGELRNLLNDRVSPYISGLSEKKVRDITKAFGTAAILAQKAGFDMIQIHGDRMCGSFSSAVFNTRTDCYGGSAENRARFAVESVSAVRTALPDMPIEYKLAIRQETPHYGNAGILKEELPIFIPLLEAAGVDCFHVALANHSELTDTIPPFNHPYFQGEGCFLRFCDEVKKYTKLPVCAVGTLSHPAFIEEQIRSGRIEYVAMCRQLIADPQWLMKAIDGKEDKIHYCIKCNKACLGGMQRHEGVHCIFDEKEEVK